MKRGLVEAIAQALLRQRLTLAVAEASTGGALADALTARPGASAFFLGGVVPYSNSSKERLLGVPAETLARYGAVSAEAAAALATGVRQAFQSDLGLAVTGILGPGGGTPAKPVGLTYIALAGPDGCRIACHQFEGDRAANKAQAVQAALSLLLEAVR